MGAFGTLFDVGHAAGPIVAGLLIGLWGGQNFRESFGLISTLLGSFSEAEYKVR